MDVRATQAPLKARYKDDPRAAMITLRASASEQDTPISCSVDIGRAVYEAEAHAGAGGTGSAACSGDLLLGALAACAQITCQLVASASGVPVRSVRVQVEGDLDLRGTLAMSREAACGFGAIRLYFNIDAPDATDAQLERLHRRTEQLCTVLQTLRHPPEIAASWGRA